MEDEPTILKTDTNLFSGMAFHKPQPQLTIRVPKSHFKRMVLRWFGIDWKMPK
jgi:hypothetical protein